jgi:hypothetical protein
MAADGFERYIVEINKAYLRGDATEHTHRPALKALIEGLGKKLTVTNEPRRIECGAPDLAVSRSLRKLEQRIGYIETKDIGTNLSQAARTEQIKKRYLPSLHNFILTDYIEFRWYVNGERQLTARLGREAKGGAFEVTGEGLADVNGLLRVFLQHEPEKIATAKELAVRMGGMARLLRDITKSTFEQEGETGALHGQFEAFREVLLHDLTEEQFADMYSQTICYGLFTAACYVDDMSIFGTDKHARFHGMKGAAGQFTRRDAGYLLPKTNPFLRKMFGHIAGPDLDDRIAWLVDDVVALLRESRMEVILRDFARRKGRRDPVVHFYETFLAEYDPKMRKTRGVYYTPDEVVSYIVRSVDWLLKEKFGLKRGLSDESKVKVNGQDAHKVLVLDPAVGTGTFLFEVIDLIYRRFKRQKGMWSGYVSEHLLPRLFGFEIQMAPYAVCHMKLGLELAETGYDFESDERLGIYLTNSLEEAEETSRTLFAQWLSDEARAAETVKRELPIMVVIGNPPYSVSSQNKGEHIERLMGLYKEAVRGETNIQPLSDDYVKFVRFAHSRIEQTGCGIVAMITNHSYLSGLVHRGMRQELLKVFDEIYILDLHGSSMTGLSSPEGKRDKNVFDIRQGVAISLLVRFAERGRRAVTYAECWGSRKEKYEYLAANDVRTCEWEELRPVAPYYFFVPRECEFEGEYNAGWSLEKVLLESSTGVGTGRDKAFVAFERGQIETLASALVERVVSDADVQVRYGLKDTSGWNFCERRERVLGSEELGNRIVAYQYRLFDIRSCLYHPIIRRDSSRIMRHMVRPNLGLLVSQQQAAKGFGHVYCTRLVVDESVLSTKTRERAVVFPLYLYETGDMGELFDSLRRTIVRGGRVPNLSRAFVEELANKVKFEFVSNGRGNVLDSRLRGNDKGTFGPEDVFDYIYAVLHSPEYRRRYAEFLKIDFPRIPLPPGKAMFRKLCKAGGQLVRLHLMEAEVLENADQRVFFGVEGSNAVERGYPKYVAHAEAPDKGKVYINKDQYFEGVRPEVWEFHIGGYQVCEKWLKDRRGRKLSFDDIRHYQKVVVALGETIRLMQEPCLVEMFETTDRRRMGNK